MKTTRRTLKNYENGRSEPKSPRLEAHQRLLKGGRPSSPPTAPPARLLSLRLPPRRNQ
ncbi:hypothetical protein [Streptomyces sp. SAI-124]|uniref:hypothetical protein n=1 Tax=Streptomyces sp. SAI-124 TaxID=3377730 RepID=UPI003C79B5B0